MREFIYVLCYYHDGDPAFVHTRMYADTVEDAYYEGMKWTQKNMAEFEGKLINDYVIEISA